MTLKYSINLKNLFIFKYALQEQYNNNYYESNIKLNTQKKFLLSNIFEFFKLEDSQMWKKNTNHS